MNFRSGSVRVIPDVHKLKIVRAVLVGNSIQAAVINSDSYVSVDAVGARRVRRVHVDHGFAPVEFLEDRTEPRIAESRSIVVRRQTHAVGTKDVERIGDFAQRRIHIAHRQ